MSDKSWLVLAPHPDDELIGCWSVRDLISHVWFAEHEASRMAEATAVASHFRWEVLTGELVIPAGITTLLMPAITDSHPLHKEVNRRYRGLSRSSSTNVKFYSVDLQDNPRKVELPALEQVAKRKALDFFYPSQGSLWESNNSYFLFECIADRDYQALQTTKVLLGAYHELTMVVHDSEFATDWPTVFADPDELINSLICRGATRFHFTHNKVEYQL